MSKCSYHNVRSAKKMLEYGLKQKIGVFRPKPTKHEDTKHKSQDKLKRSDFDERAKKERPHGGNR